MGSRFKNRHRKPIVFKAGARPIQTPIEPIRDPSVRVIRVYVEGYEDVAFWRSVFDHYETTKLQFEISVPPRKDLAKGKKVLLGMAQLDSSDTIFCMDSDFDYLFDGQTGQSSLVNDSPKIFHTHAYAIENLLCHAPSLHKLCVRATKNDVRIFDFEKFMADYSRIIYPLFLWYSFSAQNNVPSVFTLIDFRISAKIIYLEVENNGLSTLQWLERQVDKKIAALEGRYPRYAEQMHSFGEMLSQRGVVPENTYLFMQGHTLMDNVVLIAMSAVCERLKNMAIERIVGSGMGGEVLRNDVNNYNNALRNIRELLLDNENYRDCFLFAMLKSSIDAYVATLK